MQAARIYAALAAAIIALSTSPAAQRAQQVTVPVDYHKLDNGLKVVLSRDTSSPTAVVGVYYNIGFRIEPKDRTGFAHLFEHMMFQGSQHLGKNEFIGLVESNGGILNGSTRFDFTNYFEIVPSHTVETMLWGEADRMRGLNITQENLTNQQGVVKNEVKVNVLNQPLRRLSLAGSAAGRQHQLVQRPQLLRRSRASRRGDACRRAAVLQDVLRAEQRRPGGDRRHRHRADARRG